MNVFENLGDALEAYSLQSVGKAVLSAASSNQLIQLIVEYADSLQARGLPCDALIEFFNIVLDGAGSALISGYGQDAVIVDEVEFESDDLADSIETFAQNILPVSFSDASGYCYNMTSVNNYTVGAKTYDRAILVSNEPFILWDLNSSIFKVKSILHRLTDASTKFFVDVLSDLGVSSQINNIILVTANMLSTGAFIVSDFLASVNSAIGVALNGANDLLNRIVDAYVTGGFYGVVKSVASLIASTQKVSNDGPVLYFTDNNALRPAEYIAGMVSSLIESVSSFVTAIITIAEPIVGVIMSVVESIVFAIPKAINYDYSNETCMGYDETAVLPICPIAAAQYDLTVNTNQGILYDIYHMIEQYQSPVYAKVPGGVLFFGKSELQGVMVRCEFHPSIENRLTPFLKAHLYNEYGSSRQSWISDVETMYSLQVNASNTDNKCPDGSIQGKIMLPDNGTDCAGSLSGIFSLSLIDYITSLQPVDVFMPLNGNSVVQNLASDNFMRAVLDWNTSLFFIWLLVCSVDKQAFISFTNCALPGFGRGAVHSADNGFVRAYALSSHYNDLIYGFFSSISMAIAVDYSAYRCGTYDDLKTYYSSTKRAAMWWSGVWSGSAQCNLYNLEPPTWADLCTKYDVSKLEFSFTWAYPKATPISSGWVVNSVETTSYSLNIITTLTGSLTTQYDSNMIIGGLHGIPGKPYAVKVPKYNEATFAAWVAISTAATIVTALVVTATVLTVRKYRAKQRAKIARRAEEQWQNYVTNPTEENYEAYASTVFFNNTVGRVCFGSTKLSRSGFWADDSSGVSTTSGESTLDAYKSYSQSGQEGTDSQSLLNIIQLISGRSF